MTQATTNRPDPYQERVKRIDHLEQEVKTRLGVMDEKFDILREGEFIRTVIRREISHYIKEEKEAEEVKKIAALRRKKRRRMTIVLAGVLGLGGAVFAGQRHGLPPEIQGGFSFASEETKRVVSKLLEDDTPPEEGAQKMWLNPAEQEIIQRRREQQIALRHATEDLVEARVQLERWKAASHDSEVRAASIDHWQRRVEQLEAEIRENCSGLGEEDLEPIPTVSAQQ